MKRNNYLESIIDLRKHLEQLKQEVNEYKNGIYDVQSTIIDGTPRSHSRGNNAIFENKVIKLNKLENKLYDVLKMYLYAKHNAINKIQSLNNPLYSELLYKYYIERKKLKQTAKEIKISYKYIRQLHTQALKEFEKIVEKS